MEQSRQKKCFLRASKKLCKNSQKTREKCKKNLRIPKSFSEFAQQFNVKHINKTQKHELCN